MKTTHKIFYSNSMDMKEVASHTVNLIVTSPPYPMIEMWDEQFSALNPQIKNALQHNDGTTAYRLMHGELNKIWNEVDRILSHDGMVCINIGDATRSIGDSFQLYPNHSRIIEQFENMGYKTLPFIIWRKETNKPNKFMGSGMIPPNAYVTLEHEYVLIFRKGENRNFTSTLRRHASSYFWEERNIWFSDIWNNLKGISQELNHDKLRERSGAYPFELAYRLINMYSIQEDLILDPFLGTGTTMFAAICSARNFVGYEMDNNFKEIIENNIRNAKAHLNSIICDRLKGHLNFIRQRQNENKEIKHKSSIYNFDVITAQEEDIFIPMIEKIDVMKENQLEINYTKEISKDIYQNSSSKKAQQIKLD